MAQFINAIRCRVEEINNALKRNLPHCRYPECDKPHKRRVCQEHEQIIIEIIPGYKFLLFLCKKCYKYDFIHIFDEYSQSRRGSNIITKNKSPSRCFLCRKVKLQTALESVTFLPVAINNSYFSTQGLITSKIWSPQKVFSISYRAWSAERESKEQAYGENRRNELLYNSTMYWNKYASNFITAIEPDCTIDDLQVFNLITGITYFPSNIVRKCFKQAITQNNNNNTKTVQKSNNDLPQPLSINGMGNIANTALHLAKQNQSKYSEIILLTIAFTYGKHCTTIDNIDLLQRLQNALTNVIIIQKNKNDNKNLGNNDNYYKYSDSIIHVASHVIARYYEGIGSMLNDNKLLLDALKYYGIALQYARNTTNTIVPHAFLTPHSIISLLNEHPNLMPLCADEFLIAKEFIEQNICPLLKDVSSENVVNLSRAELELPIFLTWANAVVKNDLTTINLGKRRRSKNPILLCKERDDSCNNLHQNTEESIVSSYNFPSSLSSSSDTVILSSNLSDDINNSLNFHHNTSVLTSFSTEPQASILQQDEFAQFWEDWEGV